MGKTILELFQTKKLSNTQTAEQKYETRNSKDISISTPNGALNATSFPLVNKLRRSRISDRTRETVIEEELLGLRQLRFLSQPIIYGTDIIRLNRLSTNMLDDMKAGVNGNAGNNGIIGNLLNKVKGKGLELASKIGVAFPEEIIPSRVILKNDFKNGLEPNTMQTLAKIKKDAGGTLVGKFLAQNVTGTPRQIGNAVLGSGIQLAKDKVQTYLFGARKSGQQLLAKNDPTSRLYSSAMPYKDTVDYTGTDLKLRNDLSTIKNELSTIKKDGPANLSGEYLRLSKENKPNNLFSSIVGGGVSNPFSIGGGGVSNPFSIGGGGVSNVFSLPSKSGTSNVFNIPVKGANQSNVFTIPKANANNLITGRKEGQQVIGKELLKVGTGEGILKYNADNTITKYSNTVDEESLVIEQRNDLSTRLQQIGGVDPASLALINATTKDKQSTTSIGSQFAGLNKKTQQEKSLFKALAGENGLSLPNGIIIPPPAKAEDLLTARKEGQQELGRKVQESKGNDLLKYDPRLSATAYSNTVDETNDDEKSRNDLSTLLTKIQTVAETKSTGNELNITGIGNNGIPQKTDKLKYSSEEFARSIESKKSLGNAVNFLNTKNHYTDTGNDVFGDLDFITVKFTSVPNKKSVNFTATITGISENVSPSWDSAKFLGSPFNYYTYSGIERSVSFTLTLYSTNSQEHVAMWERINFLTSLAYPAGYHNETYIISPFTKVTIGNLYKDKECIIDSLSYTVDDTAGWEIGDNKSYGGNGGKVNIETDGNTAEVTKPLNGYKLPMVVSVNISLKFIESRNNTVNNFYGWNSTLPQNDIAKKLQEVNPQKKAASVTSKTPSAILSNENFNKRQTEIQQKIDKDNPFNKFLNKGRGSLLGGAGL
jgi:hypothetical protein